MYTDITELFDEFPTAQAYFNCTGIGSYSLKGVEDQKLYPQRVSLLARYVPGFSPDVDSRSVGSSPTR